METKCYHEMIFKRYIVFYYEHVYRTQERLKKELEFEIEKKLRALILTKLDFKYYMNELINFYENNFRYKQLEYYNNWLNYWNKKLGI